MALVTWVSSKIINLIVIVMYLFMQSVTKVVRRTHHFLSFLARQAGGLSGTYQRRKWGSLEINNLHNVWTTNQNPRILMRHCTSGCSNATSSRVSPSSGSYLKILPLAKACEHQHNLRNLPISKWQEEATTYHLPTLKSYLYQSNILSRGLNQNCDVEIRYRCVLWWWKSCKETFYPWRKLTTCMHWIAIPLEKTSIKYRQIGVHGSPGNAEQSKIFRRLT